MQSTKCGLAIAYPFINVHPLNEARSLASGLACLGQRMRTSAAPSLCLGNQEHHQAALLIDAMAVVAP